MNAITYLESTNRKVIELAREIQEDRKFKVVSFATTDDFMELFLSAKFSPEAEMAAAEAAKYDYETDDEYIERTENVFYNWQFDGIMTAFLYDSISDMHIDYDKSTMTIKSVYSTVTFSIGAKGTSWTGGWECASTRMAGAEK